jgi:hypothetical protein
MKVYGKLAAGVRYRASFLLNPDILYWFESGEFSARSAFYLNQHMKLGITMPIKPFDRKKFHSLLEEHRAIAAKLKLPHKIKLKSLELLRKALKSGIAISKSYLIS